MLFYDFNLLDTFITSNLIHPLKIEEKQIKEIIHVNDIKKSHLLNLIHYMTEISNLIEENKIDFFYETISSLKNCFTSITHLQLLASQLEENLTETISLYDKNIEIYKEEIKANLVEYNKQYEDLYHKILDFETSYSSLMNLVLELSFHVSNKKMKKQNEIHHLDAMDEIKIDVELEPHDSNVLIISEKNQKAYLPFFYQDILKIYQDFPQTYKTLQDVVNDLYVIPLCKFKNSSLSRFRESFHLIRNKEKGSILKAFDLALELMFQYNLNPIIIAACRNLDELDIYLDCLEQNELHDFSCFEIKFEVSPSLKTKAT